MSSPSKFTYVSLFAGCGGSSLGYKWAGGKGLCAVEFDPLAAATYRVNFPDTPVIERDIRNVSIEDILETAGLKVGDLGILDGSPPCQGFSTAGKRAWGDPRSGLWQDYIRILEGLQPQAFVMENVSGLIKGKMRLVFREIMLALKATGYQVRCKLLDAQWFGVPQSRKRVMFVGARRECGDVQFPQPCVSKPVTVREAIGHLPVSSASEREPEDAQVLKAWQAARPGMSLRRTGVPSSCGKRVGSFQSVRLDPDKPAATLKYRPPPHRHWATARHCTVEEYLILQSFPVGFQMLGENKQAKRGLIGNSVAPKMMHAIAECVRDNILMKIDEKNHAVTLQ